MSPNDLPEWQCFKRVRAAKITRIEDHGTGYLTVHLDTEWYPRHDVSIDWYHKHTPHVGGYFVLYEDGYMSYSPAQAFEHGYAPRDARGIYPGAPVLYIPNHAQGDATHKDCEKGVVHAIHPTNPDTVFCFFGMGTTAQGCDRKDLVRR